MQEVTDPELLKQLNSPEPEEVTDPELLKQLNGESDGTPGTLKSAALGLMSGIPGATAAVSGIQAMSPDTTYEEAHQNLERQKDQAWQDHGTAYGVGKSAGIVGSGALAAATAPVSIPGALASGAVMGAASGLDEAVRPADMAADAAKGAAVGGVFGGAVQGVGNMVSKALPSLGKTILSKMGNKTTREGVESYLANPDLINNAPDKIGLANKLSESVAGLSDDTRKLSGEARGLINPESFPLTTDKLFEPAELHIIHNVSPTSSPKPTSFNAPGASTEGSVDNMMLGGYRNDVPAGMSSSVVTKNGGDISEAINPALSRSTNLVNPTDRTIVIRGGPPVARSLNPAEIPEDTLKGIFDQLKSRYVQNGIAPSKEAEAAGRVLDDQYMRMRQIAQDNGGKIGEEQLKNQIVELQHISRNVYGEGTDISASKGALRDLSGALNKELKTVNEPYAEAMTPVAERTGLIDDLVDKFKLEKTPDGYKPTDATIGKMKNLIGDDKPESQELLEHLSDLTGVDVLDLVKISKMKESFTTPGSSQIMNIILHTLGYGVGKASGIPGGALVGSLLGGTVGHSVNGGAAAKSIMDSYLKFQGGEMGQALKKYGPVLINAAKQGGNQLASTYFVLSTSDPEFQKFSAEHQEDKINEVPQ